jgi:alkyl hydroperoxide reductase subunit F
MKLDTSIKDQLKTVFQAITTPIQLVIASSHHPKQAELVSMLEDLASTSDLITLRMTSEEAKVPSFSVVKDGQSTGIHFQGIPGGHEFTSLVLAVMNSAGLGKLPDAGLAQRIKALPSGLDIKTYVSLSCENCPDVVQALNQIALSHGSMQHTMIDGGLITEDMERMGIQGVPSVYVAGELLSSGRANLAELLAKLEDKFTDAQAEKSEVNLGHVDVLVVGGGPAGASAAIYSVRKGLKTALVAEKLGGQVQETKGIENLISVVYTEGPQLSANLDQHLRSYPVQILEHRRVESISGDKLKTVKLTSGEFITTDTVIIATGAKWRELGVPGEKDYIGRGVAFCPHCDGPYYKGKKVAVVGGGNSGVEAAIDLAGICREVVLLEFADKLKADDILIQKLKSLPNVSVVTEAKTTSVHGNGEKVVGMSYEHRKTGEQLRLDLDGIFVQIGLSPNSALVKGLVEINKFGEIVVDAKGRTTAPGIYAAGDVTTVPFKQIVIAMGEGAKVALTAFEDRMRA